MWRVGRKLGRTIYRQIGDEPSDNDVFIGIMDSTVDALTVVRAVNYLLGVRGNSNGEEQN